MTNGRCRVALHKARLTTRTVADAKPQDRRYIVWDDELTGFGSRISPSGLRSFIVKRPGDWYARISRVAGSKFWFHACRNCFITVAVRDLMLPESLVKRLVNDEVDARAAS